MRRIIFILEWIGLALNSAGVVRFSPYFQPLQGPFHLPVRGVLSVCDSMLMDPFGYPAAVPACRLVMAAALKTSAISRFDMKVSPSVQS
jgi:hypothetical protein